MSKTLTVAVASYNAEKYLPDTLASYVACGCDERLEVLVIDDGSSDTTAKIAHTFERLYPAVFRVISQDNAGHGGAVNTAMQMATGKYFRVIDADDWIFSPNIEALLNVLDAAEEDLVIDVKREVNVDSKTTRLLRLPDDLPRMTPLSFSDFCTRDDIEEFFIIHTVSIRTDFLRLSAIRLLEHTFYVDYELIVKLGAQAKTLRFTDLEICNYRIGNAEQSVSPANYVRRWDDHTRVTCELLDFAQNGDLPEAQRAFVEKRVGLLVNTHYNIALIYDEDRARGLARARAFRHYLKESHPAFFLTAEKRYRTALILHRLGVNAARLDKLMGR